MYIDTVPNRRSRPCILLRESYRQGGEVKKRTLANLTNWPEPVVAGLKQLLGEGGIDPSAGEQGFEIIRSLPHGHITAVLGTLRRVGLDRVISSKPSRELSLVLAMVAARIVCPGSKLATARGLCDETFSTSLGEELGVEDTDVQELYAAMDWLYKRQGRIEKKLASKHLKDGRLVLYDVTSSYFEGEKCPLARRGHSRDQKRGKLQIVFGLLCNSEGCPIAVEVFEGDTGDPSTLKSQIKKVRKRFELQHVVFVGDRGMITSARIDEELRNVEGLEWLSTLKSTQIKPLIEQGLIHPSLWDERNMAEIATPEYPGERLIVCHNPILAAKRSRVREELLMATQKELDAIVEATRRKQRRLRGKDRIGIRVGKIINRFKVGKHFRVEITDDSLSYERITENIEKEKQLDGIYVIRTSVPRKQLSDAQAVVSYKSLSRVERAFRSCKTVDLKVRPIYHYIPKRVRAHVFLCMLAYYVEWHMRRALAPILFDDHEANAAKLLRKSPVEPAQVSPAAKDKAVNKRTADGFPVHSLQSLLEDLATITKNRIQPKLPFAPTWAQLTHPTALQRRAFELLGVPLECRQ